MAAVTREKGSDTGPPGVGLRLAGDGYPCSEVSVYFDGERIGVVPASDGSLRATKLSVPGDAEPGDHVIDTRCTGTDRIVASSTFEVSDRSVHRSFVVTALHSPLDVRMSLRDAAVTAGATMFLALLIFFPCGIFEETLDNNYAEVRGWFGLKGDVKEVTGKAATLRFIVFMGVCAALYTGLDPGAGFDLATGAVFLALLVGLAAAVLFEGVPMLLFGRRHGLKAPLRALPGSVFVALVLVLMSRFLNFNPGYAFGAIAGFTVAGNLERRQKGSLSLAAILTVLAVSVAAWFAWVPVQRLASVDEPGFLIVLLEAALACTFMIGIESCLILALPMRFLHGGEIVGWNRWAWALSFGASMFVFVHVLIRGGTGYIAQDSASIVMVLVLAAVFGSFVLGFWSYFRFRPERVPA